MVVWAGSAPDHQSRFLRKSVKEIIIYFTTVYGGSRESQYPNCSLWRHHATAGRHALKETAGHREPAQEFPLAGTTAHVRSSDRNTFFW